MTTLDSLKRRFAQQMQSTPAAVGYAGVPDDWGYPGVSVGGFIYDIPDKPGYQYFRATQGVEQEVGEAVIGGLRRSPNRKIAFDLFGGALVSRTTSPLAAVAGSGADAPDDFLPDAHSILYDPADEGWDVERVGAALDDIRAGTTVFDRILVDDAGNVLTDDAGNVLVGD